MVRFSIVKRLKYIQNKAINKRQQEIDMNRKEKEKIPKPLVFMDFERVFLVRFFVWVFGFSSLVFCVVFSFWFWAVSIFYLAVLLDLFFSLFRLRPIQVFSRFQGFFF